MGESVKATCALLSIVALLVSAVAWYEDQPGQTTWIVRIASPVVGLLSLVVLLLVHFRRDRVPDFLRAKVGNYFNHRGFCFVVGAEESAGVCQIAAWFQNQYERPSLAQIELRPLREFWLDAHRDRTDRARHPLRSRRIRTGDASDCGSREHARQSAFFRRERLGCLPQRQRPPAAI